MTSLPNVTLVAVTSVKKPEHEEALKISQQGIKFGDVKLLDLKTYNINDWNKAIIYELPKHIKTDYCILVHADGYIINPEIWSDSWLDWDYIGAPWPLPRDDFSYRDSKNIIQRVGNSVSLRSKRLLDLPNQLNLEWKAFHGFTNEDGFICVNYRHIYEQHGMKFAPLEVAKYFSKEHEMPENRGIKTFAFHKYRYD